MKTNFLVFLFLLTIGCSKEYKAKALIDKSLKESLYDYGSYEVVSCSELDSAYSSVYSDPQMQQAIKKWQSGLTEYNYYDSIHKRRSNIFGSSHWIAEESHDEAKLYLSKLWACKQDMDSLERVFTPEFIGFKMTHRFRVNNGIGAKMIYELVFFFDSEISKVIKTEEPTND